MIQITFTIDSDGKRTSQPTIHVSGSPTIHPLEVSSLWQIWGNGGFERDVKRHLEKLCAERGLNAAELIGH